jgi:hypothetical protein
MVTSKRVRLPHAVHRYRAGPAVPGSLGAGVAKYRLLAAAAGAPLLLGLDNGKGGWLTHSVPDEGFGAMHEVEYWLRVVALLGAKASTSLLHANYTQAGLLAVAPLLHGLGPEPLVVIHPGSGGYSLARRWEPVKWAAVADELVRRAATAGVGLEPAGSVTAAVQQAASLARPGDRVVVFGSFHTVGPALATLGIPL